MTHAYADCKNGSFWGRRDFCKETANPRVFFRLRKIGIHETFSVACYFLKKGRPLMRTKTFTPLPKRTWLIDGLVRASFHSAS
jgi:hypothetical protein